MCFWCHLAQVINRVFIEKKVLWFLIVTCYVAGRILFWRGWTIPFGELYVKIFSFNQVPFYDISFYVSYYFSENSYFSKNGQCIETHKIFQCITVNGIKLLKMYFNMYFNMQKNVCNKDCNIKFNFLCTELQKTLNLYHLLWLEMVGRVC